jgi:hypothetical protein
MTKILLAVLTRQFSRIKLKHSMKTTFDLPLPLIDQAKKLAAQRNTTMKELVISGLRKVIDESTHVEKTFKLQNASVKGNGLQAGVRHLSASQLIEFSYESDKS